MQRVLVRNLTQSTSRQIQRVSSTMAARMGEAPVPENTSLERERSDGMAKLRRFDDLRFDNLALRRLPLDPIQENYIRSKVPGAFFSRVSPGPVKNPQLVAFSPAALQLLDIDPRSVVEEREKAAEYFSGNQLLPGSEPAAHCYCGHQFGFFSGQLGDGAAMYLGEVINSKNERWELQFKGAGPTPYSRHADGRKVLRSSLREFLCSEAMFSLGVPTTRAGTIVKSESTVARDPYYDGRVIQEPITIITRIAPTFIRFGSFEIFKEPDEKTGRSGPSWNHPEKENLKKLLLDYVVETFYPHIWNRSDLQEEDKYSLFFSKLVQRTAHLVAHWQTVGFCHGVLNTDNMSIIGLTVDYGPFAFMEYFDPEFICNGSDHHGRYTYKRQPEICKWNCEVLAEQLEPLLDPQKAKEAVKKFDELFQAKYSEILRHKLGLSSANSEDYWLFTSLFEAMEDTGSDFTKTFLALSRIEIPAGGTDGELNGSGEKETEGELPQDVKAAVDVIMSNLQPFEDFRLRYKPQVPEEKIFVLMQWAQQRPAVLEELGLSVAFVEDEVKRLEKRRKWRNVTQEQKMEADRKVWVEWLLKYRRRLASEAEGMSGEGVEALRAARLERMKRANPRFILRNFIAQQAIEAAAAGKSEEVQKLVHLLESPYDEVAGQKDFAERPKWARCLKVTCSS